MAAHGTGIGRNRALAVRASIQSWWTTSTRTYHSIHFRHVNLPKATLAESAADVVVCGYEMLISCIQMNPDLNGRRLARRM